jgi:Zn-dependent protease
MDLSLSIQNLSIRFIPFILAVVFHEYGHGLIAKLFGDKTAEKEGRLTLNPLPHIDPLGTLVLPMINMFSGTNFLIGWAKPMPINPARFSHYKKGMIWVSLAGPLTNMVLAFISGLVLFTLQRWVGPSFFFYEPLFKMAYSSVMINYGLAIFNLLPLPPLDGAQLVRAMLSYEASRKFDMIAQYSFFIFLALMFSGLFSLLALPITLFTGLTLWFTEKIVYLF